MASILRFRRAFRLDLGQDPRHRFATRSGDPNAQQCGWLKDRFGVSWQVVPTVLPALLNDPDRAAAERVMRAMLQMKRLDIAGLEAAREGV